MAILGVHVVAATLVRVLDLVVVQFLDTVVEVVHVRAVMNVLNVDAHAAVLQRSVIAPEAVIVPEAMIVIAAQALKHL